jgi:uncharacterized protein (TIGR02646 family)
MRPILKQGQGSRRLRQKALNPPQTPEQATASWRAYGESQTLLREHLLPEQLGLCGYSEVDGNALGLGFHVEHVENKRQNPARTFDYGNLIASAFSSAEGLAQAKAQGVEVFGGQASGKQGRPQPVDMAKFVSPLQRNCSQFFAYLSDGRITSTLGLSAADEARADYTIEVLNLNSPYLVSLRKNWWAELDALFDDHATRGWSLPDLAAVDLLPNGAHLSRFFSLTRQFFGPVAEGVLQNSSPAL